MEPLRLASLRRMPGQEVQDQWACREPADLQQVENVPQSGQGGLIFLKMAGNSGQQRTQ